MPMTEAKSIEKLSYYTTSIGLIYVVIGILGGFYLVYTLISGGSPPSMMISAHSHFLCMSTLILIVGIAMRNWATEIENGRFILSGALLRAAQISVALLALGNIITFIFYSLQSPEPGLIGDIIYFLGFLIVALGWIIGGRKIY